MRKLLGVIAFAFVGALQMSANADDNDAPPTIELRMEDVDAQGLIRLRCNLSCNPCGYCDSPWEKCVKNCL